MAIRNDNLGGTDWAYQESPLKSQDLNDTFDALYNLAVSNPAFWLSSTISSVYDDFSGYSVGSFSTNSLWDVDIVTNSSNTITADITSTDHSGFGSGQELKMSVSRINTNYNTTARIIVKAINLTANRHSWFSLYSEGLANNAGGNSNLCPLVSFDKGSTNHRILTVSNYQDDAFFNSSIQVLVIAKGNNSYDCYVNGKFVQTVTDASFQVWFLINGNVGIGGSYTNLYITKASQSIVDVN